jgi:cytoplasmic tRNA 2-thiolation protein 1
VLLSIDEGISGYRDDSLDTVKLNEATYGIPLHVFSYKDLYGWTMDEIVAAVGTRNNCTFCGVFRRQSLDRGAERVGAGKIATGHNADDVAETVLLNLVRADLPRLGRCAAAVTGGDSDLPRVKPFKYTYEKEIVMYAYFKRLDYFSTECIYAPFAARGFAREFVKDLEVSGAGRGGAGREEEGNHAAMTAAGGGEGPKRCGVVGALASLARSQSLAHRASSAMQAARPRAIVDLIRTAENLRLSTTTAAGGVLPQPGTCQRCGYISSQEVCKACTLLEGLNRGLPQLGISRKGRKQDKRPAVATAGAGTEQLFQGASTGAACRAAEAGRDGGGGAAAAHAACGSGCCKLDCGGAAVPVRQQHAYLESKGSIAAHPSARTAADPPG